MSQTLLLGRRALREALRTPESLAPTLLIPLFFLVVNVGQAGKNFPSSTTEFRKGQSYAAFQLPSSLPFGISVASGIPGFPLLLVLTPAWAVVYAGFMQFIALKSRSAAATNSGGLVFFPLRFLTPNFVPRDMLT